jgi:hypothetical protein
MFHQLPQKSGCVCVRPLLRCIFYAYHAYRTWHPRREVELGLHSMAALPFDDVLFACLFVSIGLRFRSSDALNTPRQKGLDNAGCCSSDLLFIYVVSDA